LSGLQVALMAAQNDLGQRYRYICIQQPISNQAKDAVSQMPKNHLLFFYTLVFTSFTVACAFLVSGILALGLATLICFVMWILSFTLRSPHYGANKLRMVALVPVVGLVVSRGGWAPAVNSAISSLASSKQLDWLPQWIKTLNFSPALTIPEMLFSLALLLLVFHYTRIPSDNNQAALTTEKLAGVPNAEIDSFCVKLRHDIIALDTQSGWNPQDYAELEAEVEVRSSHGLVRRKRVLNLQKVIRVDGRPRSFLLLGVPGAGKSVALRRLALHMLEKRSDSSCIPVYVNLREWVPTRVVEQGQVKFQFSDLRAFVIKKIINGEAAREAFVDQYFDQLVKEGRLYFIFDSFDEISEVLDAGQDEAVINALSEVISRFISTDQASKGILASRMFRRPTAFQAHKVLEIRPLSESAALGGLSRFANLAHQKSLDLLTQRPDLSPLMRNPFMMVLLGDWISHEAQLPDNQAQIYERFILNKLEARRPQLVDAGVTTNHFMMLTTELAWFVFHNSSYGLEAPVKDINAHFQTEQMVFVLRTLRAIGIARVTVGDAPSFAFMHRRFLEYFVTRKLLVDPTKAPISDIPKDARGRDALVLYAQICPPAEAARIARLCWDEIEVHFDDESQRMRAIHCLRFLVDAFCFRRDAIHAFGDELHEFVSRHVGGGDNLVFAKICLEATGLLPEIKTAPMLSLALSGGDDWLQETAFKACRYLPKVEKGLQDDIAAYLLRIPDFRFWRTRKGLLLSLSLSEALRGVYFKAQLRVYNLMTSAVAAMVVAGVAPKGLAVGGVYAFFFAIFPQYLFDAGPKKRSQKQTVPVSDQKLSKPAGINWVAMGGAERALIVLRYMTAGGLVVFCLMGLMGWLPAPKGGICVVYWCGMNWFTYQVVCLALAMLLLDWVVALMAVRKLLPLLVTVKFWLIVMGVVLGCAAVIFGLVLLSSELAAYTNYLNYFLALLVILAVIALVAFGIWGWWREQQDRNQLKRLRFAGAVNRVDIAHTMGGLRTTKGQILFVQRLEQHRVKAHGQWPEGFTLSVGQGPAMTGLAQLEERWLGLDR